LTLTNIHLEKEGIAARRFRTGVSLHSHTLHSHEPLSLIYRKGLKLDGSHPTILRGYGSYGGYGSYAGYPALLALLRRARPLHSRRDPTWTPTVTACVAAYNALDDFAGTVYGKGGVFT